MSNKIDPPVGPPAATAPVQPVVRSREQATAPNSTPSRAGDSVALTGEAQAMQQLEQRMQEETGVDEAKVAELRRILAQGLYSADPQAIAARLMRFEHSLGSR